MISAIFYWTDNSNFVGDTKGFRTVKKAAISNIICNFEITVKDTT
jgi:hypothetical protein